MKKAVLQAETEQERQARPDVGVGEVEAPEEDQEQRDEFAQATTTWCRKGRQPMSQTLTRRAAATARW
jgi:hypothetical protein